MLFPPDATYAGKSLGEWEQAYQLWVATITGPAENHPWVNDGPSFQINQQGPVFFLGYSGNWSDPIPAGTPNPGSSYSPEQRHVTVPAHTAVYLGVDENAYYIDLQSSFDEFGVTAEQFSAEVLDGLLSFMPVNSTLEIDGTTVPIDTTANSPYLNSGYITNLPVPPDSVIRSYLYGGRDISDHLAYVFTASISALIKPLPVGEHTVKVRTFDSYYGYPFSELAAVDWHITVTR